MIDLQCFAAPVPEQFGVGSFLAGFLFFGSFWCSMAMVKFRSAPTGSICHSAYSLFL